ncbi:hypothetical protein LIER_28561 [Lithospermum erythrorhizon]|uniref:Calcium uniporter protein C-terminal domain-containing protein n=1 Tax=Lithospermum erythrorhizon TaxID=34254 RepID=A0AAV3RM23_LITER
MTMAFRKTLAQRLFKISQKTASNSLHICRVSSSSTSAKSIGTTDSDDLSPDPGNDGVFRRFIHRRPAYGSPANLPELWSMHSGEKLMERFKAMGIGKDRITLDVLRPPVEEVGKLKPEDARKLMKLACLEMVKLKLRQTQKNCLSYDEFVGLCSTTLFGEDQGVEVAKMLDQSGTVIVLGDVVFIRPEQVMKAIKGLIPEPRANVNDSRMKEELAEMEKQKVFIDQTAKSLVQKELWCGLGYLVIQTAAFMRLTFWELTWDVMEPICFYVTSMYFMAGYAFFLRTAKEPSFEGFFEARFSAKQRKLMKLHNFDIEKYNQLRRACYGDAFREPESSISYNSKFGDFHGHVVR